MTKIGYARVSSAGQNLDGQRAALVDAGCSIIRAECASGRSRHGRDELQTVMDFMREGDELVVQRIDRLGRRITDVLTIVDELRSKNATLRVLEPPITTADHITGQIMITALGMAAELERTFLLERQRAGIERRREADKLLPPHKRAYRGRTAAIDRDQVIQLTDEGLGPTAIAGRLGISRMTVYRALADRLPSSGRV